MDSFLPLKNDLLIRAAQGAEVERVPVWAMRQAGRYLEEFRQVRAEHDFFTVCRTPDLACEVTLQPLRRFELDAAIIFSDILVIPQALGMEVQMVPGKGPVFPSPLVSTDEIKNLNHELNVEKELSYVFDAITLTRKKLEGRVPLIGFSGAPWTLMAYMVEGGSSHTFSKARAWLYRDENSSVTLLNLLTTTIIEYLVLQVKAGAQILQVFESHAGKLGQKLFRKYSLPFLKKIVTEVKFQLKDRGLPSVPMIVFAKDAHYALDDLCDTDYDVIGLDWTIDPEMARKVASSKGKTLQGNLDPAALYGTSDSIYDNTKDMISSFGTQSYIANLGHGMYPDMNPLNLKAYVDAVHSISESMISKENS